MHTQLTEHLAVVWGKPEEKFCTWLQISGGEEHDVMVPLKGQNVTLHGIPGWLHKHQPVTLSLLTHIYRVDTTIVENLCQTQSKK